MKPILYLPDETEFSTNGIGILSDALSCTVTEARNGEFELRMTYPVAGIHYADIAARSLILAKPNPVDDPQPFRVYRITRPIGGVVTVYGEHISYDLAGIPVSPFTASNAGEALQKLKSSSAVANPFTFWTDKTTAATMNVTVPSSLRALLGGQQGSVLDAYGGEYKFDRYQVRLYGQRGQDRGVTIRYGKNLTDLEQDENIAGVYTGVYPYWAGIDGGLVQLPEKIIPAPGTYNFVRIMALDLSGEFQAAPTEAELRARAEAYMKANNIGVPTVSLSVSFVQLEQTEEYKDLALLERVELCDTVGVEFPALGVSASAKCIRTEYDVLLDRYTFVDLGDARTNLADTIAAQQQQLKQVPDRTYLQQAIDSATDQITGNKGGHVKFVYSADGKTLEEILIMDTPDIATAKKVWRWNKAGLGYSDNGYNGPYGLAMTQDGAIVADFITTGSLSANLIKSGRLESQNGMTSLNLETGALSVDTNQDTHMFLNSIGLAFYDTIGVDGSPGTNFIGAFGVENGRCQLTLYNKTKARSYELAGIFCVMDDGKSEIAAHRGKINHLMSALIEGSDIFITKDSVVQGILRVNDAGNVEFFTLEPVNFTAGIKTPSGLSITDANGTIIGSFGLYPTYNASRLVVDYAEIKNLKVTNNLDAPGGGGGYGDDLTVSSLDAGIVYTDALLINGVAFEPEEIVDKNGTTWTVLARVED